MAAPESKSAQKVVLGTMTFGREGVEQARVHDLKDCAAILDVFQNHGHVELDTARGYGGGSSEQYLGELGWAQRGLVLATKLAPGARALGAGAEALGPPYSHRADAVGPALLESLAALRSETVDLWYLHAPDRSVPYAETLRAVNALHRAGYFRRFGVSNYAAWEVAEMAELCARHGWKAPDVYQGVYNALQRAVEPELFPCLRRYGIAFYAYSPLAGGLLADRYTGATAAEAEAQAAAHAAVAPGSRFDPARAQGATYRQRYWNDAYFGALAAVRPVLQAHGIASTADAALRWLSHHSALRRELGDAIIVGASSPAQLEANLAGLEQGPLPAPVVAALDAAWAVTKAASRPYFIPFKGER